ncbi:SET domain-containing protein [Dictyostelium discoideum AX4]|uniref:SET domain-containing protein n=1 Tax=Dictyostelium discoideum TaxID=44689 RepID=C7G064_DICDI|nr:SET domain-containing protein [Dictyostelium discoideum AX4]EEU04054.1 SET domain-containing protein [Dictyostelium discoideum AX4]|eukprot:XP_002649106.1 SET domain-containing protein [Dictyostelium discoideum AX4]
MKKDEKQFQQFPNKGRTVQANTDLPKGSTVFRCAPFASSIEDSDKLATEKYCGFCLQRIPKSDSKECLCKNCKLYSVCKSCRSINESAVEPFQIIIKSTFHLGSDTRDMRLLLRIIANIANGKQGMQTPIDDYQDFMGLTSTLDKVDKEHMTKFKRGVTSISSLISSVRGVGYLKNTITIHEILECFSSVLTNAHQFSYATSKEIGRGVCPTGYFNHSCMPNTTWSLDDQGMLLFSTSSNVKKGDELSLGYLANEYPLKNRRRELLDGYYFFCQCPLCEFQSNLSGYLCEKCKEPLLNDSIVYHEPSLTNPLDTGIGLIKHLRKMIDFRQQSVEFKKMFSSEQLSNILQKGVPKHIQSVFNCDASDNEELQQIVEISERSIKSLPLINGEPIDFYPLSDRNYYEYFKQLKNSKISSPEELQRIKDKILSLINPTIYNSFKDKIDKRLLI